MTSDEQGGVRSKFRQAFRLFGGAAGEAVREGISRLDRIRRGSATRVAEPKRAQRPPIGPRSAEFRLKLWHGKTRTAPMKPRSCRTDPSDLMVYDWIWTGMVFSYAVWIA